MKPAPFEYYAPTTVDEALSRLTELGYSGKVLAGGQSLIPAMNFRMARPAALVDLNKVKELFFIKPTSEGGLAIGTMTRVSTVEHSPAVAERFPLIVETVKYIAHPQIRNRGTFGGAIARGHPDCEVLGVDVSPPLVAVARERGGHLANCRFACADAVQLIDHGLGADVLPHGHGILQQLFDLFHGEQDLDQAGVMIV